MTNRLRLWLPLVLLRPALGALLLLACGSLFPLRLDLRNFQDQRRTAGLDLPRGVPYLFVSADTDVNAYRFADYVLHNLGYPSQDRCWLVLGSAAPERATWALRVDEHGRLWPAAAGADHVSQGPERLRSYLDSGVVLYDDAASRAEAERRLPDLASAREARVLAPAGGAPLVRRRPAGEFSLRRLVRLTALLALPFTLYALARRRLAEGRAARGLAASLALLASAAGWIWFLSWSQVTPFAAPGPWPFAAWGVASLGLWRALGQEPRREAAPPRRFAAGATVVLGVYVALCVLRLDFDEDAHIHWMLMARSYYDLGRHVPERLTSHVHAATYPYAFAELVGLCAWAADLPRAAFLGLDPGTSLALLFYRLLVAALDLAALGLLAGGLRLAFPQSRSWLGVPALLLALFPILQGRHVGAETLLLPLMAGAIGALLLGRRLERPAVFALGLFVGAAATLVKLEAGLLFAAVVLPWAVDSACFRRLRGPVLPALLLGLVPTLVWRLTLTAENTVYLSPTLAHLLQARGAAPGVFLRCAQVLAKEGLAFLFFGVLPVAAACRFRRARAARAAWLELLVPASIWAACAGLAGLYLFSTLPRTWQIDVSYARLLLLPSFSAVLYCAEALLPWPLASARPSSSAPKP